MKINCILTLHEVETDDGEKFESLILEWDSQHHSTNPLKVIRKAKEIFLKTEPSTNTESLSPN